MGNAYAYRGRLTPALIALALLALAIVAFGMVAGPANAQTTFTVCSGCHDYAYNDAFHQKTTHVAQDVRHMPCERVGQGGARAVRVRERKLPRCGVGHHRGPGAARHRGLRHHGRLPRRAAGHRHHHDDR